MARYFIRKKKVTNECDGAPVACPTCSDFGIGMGPVNPIGGPDRFDTFLPVVKKSRKKMKLRKK
jgi:hypothetical protein